MALGSYELQTGDDLSVIATAAGMTEGELEAANPDHPIKNWWRRPIQWNEAGAVVWIDGAGADGTGVQTVVASGVTTGIGGGSLTPLPGTAQTLQTTPGVDYLITVTMPFIFTTASGGNARAQFYLLVGGITNVVVGINSKDYGVNERGVVVAERVWTATATSHDFELFAWGPDAPFDTHPGGSRMVAYTLTPLNIGTGPQGPAGPAGAGISTYGSFYLSTGGGTAISTTPTTLVINATHVNEGSVLTLASNVVTVSEAGDYEINYDCSFNTGGTSRSEYNVWVEVNSIEIAGTRSAVYQRGYDSGGTATGSVILTIAAADTVRLRTVRTNGGATTGYQDDNGTRLTLKKVS